MTTFSSALRPDVLWGDDAEHGAAVRAVDEDQPVCPLPRRRDLLHHAGKRHLLAVDLINAVPAAWTRKVLGHCPILAPTARRAVRALRQKCARGARSASDGRRPCVEPYPWVRPSRPECRSRTALRLAAFALDRACRGWYLECRPGLGARRSLSLRGMSFAGASLDRLGQRCESGTRTPAMEARASTTAEPLSTDVVGRLHDVVAAAVHTSDSGRELG